MCVSVLNTYVGFMSLPADVLQHRGHDYESVRMCVSVFVCASACVSVCVCVYTVQYVYLMSRPLSKAWWSQVCSPADSPRPGEFRPDKRLQSADVEGAGGPIDPASLRLLARAGVGVGGGNLRGQGYR